MSHTISKLTIKAKIACPKIKRNESINCGMFIILLGKF